MWLLNRYDSSKKFETLQQNTKQNLWFKTRYVENGVCDSTAKQQTVGECFTMEFIKRAWSICTDLVYFC